MRKYILILITVFIGACVPKPSGQSARKAVKNAAGRRAEVLFLGHHSKHHDADKYAPWLAIKLFKSGVNLSYTTDVGDLNAENLKKYDGLIIYANHEVLSPGQEQALRDFVEGGKGLIPLHSASGCFRNSEWYIRTIGGQFASHKTGRFANKILKPDHPVMKGVGEFETWDETYVHKNLNPDIVVLGERVEGDHHEPYTWVRTQGKGRVFYTAYGHEDQTWTNRGFLDLVRNGVLWALGDQVRAEIAALNIPDADIYNSDTISKYTRRHLVPKMQEALSPAESGKLTQVQPGFELQLFAAEPDITNPIAMAWDERGRLWIVESVDYPNTFRETDGAANDRIKICEDTDGDGRADKFTVFADSLNIPTSMVFANGGIIVSMAPHFVFLKDTDGDDKADVSEILMTGWGKSDTHAGPSNLMYGFDNKIWGVNGYSGFNGTVNGKKLAFGQGVYRLNPDGTEFEFLAPTSNNTWGLGISEDNNIFISTANNTHSAFYSMPGRMLQRSLPDEPSSLQGVQKIDGHYDAHPLTPNLRQVDVVGGFTSAAGHRLYTARNYPEQYWNRIAFVTEPTIRLVHNAILERDGAGFREADGWNFVASSDEWFGPVHAEVGPDGAVWIADWYNFIIQHNVFVPAQAPSEYVLPFIDQPHGQGNAFISPLRDLNHGRIYRVVYKNGNRPAAPMKLSVKDTPGLLAALENDNMFWRMTAQRLLVESKNKAAIPGLHRIASDRKTDKLGLNGPAVHALWTLHGLGALDGSDAASAQVAASALTHPAAGVRKAAVQVLPAGEQTFEKLLESKVTDDPDLNTRLAVIVALADYPRSKKIGEWVFKASQNAGNTADKWLRRALFAAAVTHEEGFLAAAAQGSGNELSDKFLVALKKEVYPLGRRMTMQYSPDPAGKEISFRANVVKSGDGRLQGFIAGQGGKESGYGLYVQDGRLHFTVRQHGRVADAVTSAPLPDKFELTALLSKDGLLSIGIDGKQAATAKAHGLFTNIPEQPLRTGEDAADPADRIGDYDGRFGLTGHFQNAVLELRRPVAGETATVVAGDKPAAGTRTDGAVTIDLKVVPDMMQYDKKLILVKAGQKVVLTLENPDGMQHNLLLIKPGTLQKVGKAADEMLRDPQAAEKQYVPQTPDVLYATRLIGTGESAVLEFTVPDKPGDYPYVCTFPGHWRGMNGILRVEK